MEPYSLSYRIIKSSWGIAIDLSAEGTPITQYSGWDDLHRCAKVINGLWYSTKDNVLSSEDEEWLVNGLKMIGNLIVDRCKPDKDILIVFHQIDFNPCDYQPEGLAAAVMQWAVNAMGIVLLEDVEVSFNKQLNKYEFHFPKY